MKPKKVFLGEDIREKEIKLGPHRGTTKDGPPSGGQVGSRLGPRRAGVTVQHGDAFQTFFSFSSLILCPSFLYLPRELFYDFHFTAGNRPFLTPIFFPEGGPTYVVPLWGPNLISFSLISSPKKTFLGFNLQGGICSFLTPIFF